MEATLKVLLENELKTLASIWDMKVATGRRLAQVVKERINPEESEAHRQAVEEAEDVIELFAGDLVKAGADEEVMGAIDRLFDGVKELTS